MIMSLLFNRMDVSDEGVAAAVVRMLLLESKLLMLFLVLLLCLPMTPLNQIGQFGFTLEPK